MIVLLDAGPLGMITNPKISPENERCRRWLSMIVHHGMTVVVPEIADYEVRRELLRAEKVEGLARLDALHTMLKYAPITTAVMTKAAQNWAAARRTGRPSAPDDDLDADMILAAQAFELGRSAQEVVIATTNTRHLELFASAQLWDRIS